MVPVPLIRRVLPFGLLLAAQPLAAQTVASAADASVTADDLRPHIAYLASDALEGRAPDSEGGRLAVQYIATQWNGLGLEPGFALEPGAALEPGRETGGTAASWYQPVAMITRKPLSGSVRFRALDGAAIVVPERMLLLSGRDPKNALQGVRLVFTGYGIAPGAPAPDLTGKLALMLAGHRKGENRNLAERAAALSKAGAAGVMLIFDEGDPLTRVSGAWYRKASELAEEDARRPAFYGGIADSAARRLFAASGDTLVEARLRADQNAALLEPLAITADLSAKSDVDRLDSFNVVAKLPGRDPDAGALLFLAHWDHLGLCRAQGAPDRICNGAVDNASGIAVLIETARRLADGPPLDRTVYFVATTGEEIGLLGARKFTEQPPVPLDSIVAAFNLDTVAVGPAGTPLAIIGRGHTPIAGDVAKVAASIGRSVAPGDDANDYLKRQDGWALLEKGVPTVMANGAFSDGARIEAFLAGDYHTPDDMLTDATDLSGAAEDADLHVALGRYFGSETSYPASPR